MFVLGFGVSGFLTPYEQGVSCKADARKAFWTRSNKFRVLLTTLQLQTLSIESQTKLEPPVGLVASHF